jgi:hypothetical protein
MATTYGTHDQNPEKSSPVIDCIALRMLRETKKTPSVISDIPARPNARYLPSVRRGSMVSCFV